MSSADFLKFLVKIPNSKQLDKLHTCFYQVGVGTKPSPTKTIGNIKLKDVHNSEEANEPKVDESTEDNTYTKAGLKDQNCQLPHMGEAAVQGPRHSSVISNN